MVSGNRRRGHAVVLGAGTMGSGIAALLASVGWRVSLLDVGDVAFKSLEKLQQSGAFYQAEDAVLITPGNVDSHLDVVESADWVLEAIIERIEPKRELWARVAKRVTPEAVLSTNTSGLGIAEIADALPPNLRSRFLGTHFFNPPRLMRLLELIPTAETDPDLVTHFTAFAERLLGKRVVLAKDRPGFITTRIGIYALMRALVQVPSIMASRPKRRTGCLDPLLVAHAVASFASPTWWGWMWRTTLFATRRSGCQRISIFSRWRCRLCGTR
jgi:3-hydroxyacyl-CoA dehydrogenase